MKILLTVVLMAFLMDASGAGIDWTTPVVQSFPSREVAEEAGRVRTMVRTTERAQPKLAGTESTALIAQLGMFGSPSSVRNWVVGRNNGFGVLNVTVGIGYTSVSGNWSETRVTKGTYGYESYTEALEDCKLGFARVWEMQETLTNYPGGTVYALYRVTYFNDDPGIASDSGGLFIGNPIGPMLSVNADTYVAELAPDKPYSAENVTIRVPSLVLVYTEVAFIGERYETNRIEWSRWSVNDGPKLSSGWPAKLPERSSEGFLIVKGIVARGEHPARLTIESASGERRVFTQFGDDLLAPVKLEIGKDKVFRINNCPRGANVDVAISTDGENWTPFGTIWSTDQVVSFSIESVDGPMALVKTSAW